MRTTQIFLLVLCCQASNIICKYTLEAKMHTLCPIISLKHADMLSRLSFSRSRRCCNCTANNLKTPLIKKKRRKYSCNTVKMFCHNVNVELTVMWCVYLSHDENVKYVISIWLCSVFHPFLGCWYPDGYQNTWISRNRNCSVGCTIVFWNSDGWWEFFSFSCKSFRQS